MASRKLNALELKLHQGALSDEQNILTSKDAEALIPDKISRVAALNFLLGVGLLKLLKHANGGVSYRAVTKQEVDVKKDLTGEEAMVLSHIQASGNEGIWTKHLKAKTELHQAIIDRCLKSLLRKQIIKDSKSHEHPTRKIYMLYHLIPSSKLTGGPWYTDNELDTEFIKLLSSACLHFIKDRSYPKLKRSAESNQQPLYPIGGNSSYPTSNQVQQFLKKSKITETELSVEHVEMLLNVLVLDGEIEKVPSFGLAMWESAANAKGKSNDDEDEDEDVSAKKYKRRRTSRIDDESSDSDTAKIKKRGRRADINEDSDTADDDFAALKRSRSKKRRDGSLSDDEDESRQNKSARKQSRSRSQNPSVPGPNLIQDAYEEDFDNAYVYRAIRQERVGLGWSQAPCGGCTVFDFCKETGPVNPGDCAYYGEWLAMETISSN